MAFSIFRGSIFWLSGQTSTNLGTALALTITEAEATKLRGVTITSSFAEPPTDPMLNLLRTSLTRRYRLRQQ